MRNDDFDSFLSWLRLLGYDTAVCWDNCGRFVGEVPMMETRLLKQLMAFFNGAPEIPFLDMGFFHQKDRQLRNQIVDDEIEISCKLFSQYEPVARKSLHDLYK